MARYLLSSPGSHVSVFCGAATPSLFCAPPSLSGVRSYMPSSRFGGRWYFLGRPRLRLPGLVGDADLVDVSEVGDGASGYAAKCTKFSFILCSEMNLAGGSSSSLSESGMSSGASSSLLSSSSGLLGCGCGG